MIPRPLVGIVAGLLLSAHALAEEHATIPFDAFATLGPVRGFGVDGFGTGSRLGANLTISPIKSARWIMGGMSLALTVGGDRMSSGGSTNRLGMGPLFGVFIGNTFYAWGTAGVTVLPSTDQNPWGPFISGLLGAHVGAVIWRFYGHNDLGIELSDELWAAPVDRGTGIDSSSYYSISAVFHWGSI